MRILFVALLALPLLAQEPKGGARPAPKNLQLLKPEEIRDTMRSFTVALGGKCDMCHVKGDFASDENEHKVMARKMIVMTREINTKFPDGKVHVTCFTCHRGSHEPAMAPDAAAAPAAN
jgi:hypothetical protein